MNLLAFLSSDIKSPGDALLICWLTYLANIGAGWVMALAEGGLVISKIHLPRSLQFVLFPFSKYPLRIEIFTLKNVVFAFLALCSIIIYQFIWFIMYNQIITGIYLWLNMLFPVINIMCFIVSNKKYR